MVSFFWEGKFQRLTEILVFFSSMIYWIGVFGLRCDLVCSVQVFNLILDSKDVSEYLVEVFCVQSPPLYPVFSVFTLSTSEN